MITRTRCLIALSAFVLIVASGCGKEPSAATTATPQPVPAPVKGGAAAPGGKQMMILKE